MDLIDLLAKMDERLAKMDERADAAAARQDALLAKMDDRLAAQDAILAHLVTLTDIARQEATAAHQTAALALGRYAETRLDVDRFIATAERVLAAWARQQP
jgi:hypothetical protein